MDLALNIFLWHFVSHYAQQPMQHMTFCNQTANGHWQTSPPLPFSILLEQIALFAQKNPSATCKIKLTPLIICVKQIYYNFHYTQFIASQNHTGTSAFFARNMYWDTDWGLSTGQKTGDNTLYKSSYLVKPQKKMRQNSEQSFSYFSNSVSRMQDQWMKHFDQPRKTSVIL